MNLQMIHPIKKNDTCGSIKWHVYFHLMTRVVFLIDACVIFTSSSNALYHALLAYSKKMANRFTYRCVSSFAFIKIFIELHPLESVYKDHFSLPFIK